VDRLRYILAALIATVWAISFTTDILKPSYEIPASVHAAMLLVAGFVFGSGVFKKDL
jgi:hypothetical protein